MAYTSIIPVHRLDDSVRYVLNEKKTSRSQNADSLREAVDYALNWDKTEQDLFESAIGCTLETAFADMCRVKKMWHKEGGVQGFHLVQSFAPGEGTPEQAHQIGLELAENLLDGRFQAVIATHLNTGHLHNHIVWNSVSMVDGKKYRSNAKTYITQVRRISDELCRKYELSVIQTQNSEKVARPYVQWLAEQNGKPTWKTLIRQDVDAAALVAFTWNQFVRELEKKGYTFRFDRKYATLCPPGRDRPVRFKTLGEDYTPDAIQKRILEPKPFLPAGKKRRRRKLRTGGKSLRKLTGLRALYVSYLYKMGALPRKPSRSSFAVREDIRRLDKRIAQMQFLSKHRIDNREQLAALEKEAEAQISALLRERRMLYQQKSNPPDLAVLNERLRLLRNTAKLCREIAEQSAEMEKRMRAVQPGHQQEKDNLEKEKER
mgnify:CR=1 FL=1